MLDASWYTFFLRCFLHKSSLVTSGLLCRRLMQSQKPGKWFRFAGGGEKGRSLMQLKMMPPHHSHESIPGYRLIAMVTVAFELRVRCIEREAGRKLLQRPGPVRPLYMLVESTGSRLRSHAGPFFLRAGSGKTARRMSTLHEAMRKSDFVMVTQFLHLNISQHLVPRLSQKLGSHEQV